MSTFLIMGVLAVLSWGHRVEEALLCLSAHDSADFHFGTVALITYAGTSQINRVIVVISDSLQRKVGKCVNKPQGRNVNYLG